MKRYDTHLDRLMSENGITTDKELAEKIGLSSKSLSFRLKDKLSMDTVERLTNYFGVTVKDFLI